jgi:hypothetical protein
VHSDIAAQLLTYVNALRAHIFLRVGMGGMDNPLAIAQMLSNMDPQMQAQMAQQMGVSPDQLRQLAQVCTSMQTYLLCYTAAESACT